MGFFKKGWWKKVVTRVVQVVATAINPAIGLVLSAALELLLDNQQKSFASENPIVEKRVTEWIDTIFTPYLERLTANLNIGESLQELVNPTRISKLNAALRDLVTLKVYLDLEITKSSGDVLLINQYKSETVDFFIKNISKGYIKAVAEQVAKQQGNDITIEFVTKREEFEASKVITLGGIIPLRWYGQKIFGQYDAFTTQFNINPSGDVIVTKPVDDPIGVPPIEDPLDNDPVIVTGGSGSGSGSDGTVADPVDNSTIQPNGSSIPWKWIVGGIVVYALLKKK